MNFLTRIFNWWNSLSRNNRRLFDVGVLLFPFHVGYGLMLYFQSPMIILISGLVTIFFIILNILFK